MTPNKTDIKIQAIRIGVSFATMAKELGVARGTVSRVVAGHAKSKRILDYVLARLGFNAKAKEKSAFYQGVHR